MKRLNNVKRFLILLLTLSISLTVFPDIAKAAPSYDDEVDLVYEHVFEAGMQGITYSYSAAVNVYSTPGAVEVINTYNGDLAKLYSVEFKHSDWYFAGWKTWYTGGKGVILDSFYETTVDKANPMFDDGSGSYFNVYQKYVDGKSGPYSIQVNKEHAYTGVYSVYAIFEPLVKVNAGDGVTYVFNGGENRDVNTYSVKSHGSASISYEVDSKYVLTKTSTEGTIGNVEDNVITMNRITGPVTVSINTRLKQQEVIFDNNTGSGEMEPQSFDYNVSETLNNNEFSKVGYLFKGWNTEKDGNGIYYSNQQSITFTPVNDKETITLYAQWEECTNHIWNDKTCDKCKSIKEKGQVITPVSQNTITYGSSLSEVELNDQWIWEDETVVPAVENEGYKAYYIPEDIENYDWDDVEGWNASLGRVERIVPVNVHKKGLTLTWGNTTFIYDGSEKFPEVYISGIYTSDDVRLIFAGAQKEVGENYIAEITGLSGEDASNYELLEGTSTTFTIEPRYYSIYVDEEMVGGSVSVSKTSATNNETFTYEVHTSEGYELVEVVLTDNNYVVYGSDYKENGMFIMPEHDVIVRASFKLKEYSIQIPSKQDGYKLETDVETIEHGGDVYISLVLKEGYEKTKDFALKVNGEIVELTEYDNVIVSAYEDLIITVEGIEKVDKEAPETNDLTNIGSWFMFMIMSLFVMVKKFSR